MFRWQFNDKRVFGDSFYQCQQHPVMVGTNDRIAFPMAKLCIGFYDGRPFLNAHPMGNLTPFLKTPPLLVFFCGECVAKR